jgi:integrase
LHVCIIYPLFIASKKIHWEALGSRHSASHMLPKSHLAVPMKLTKPNIAKLELPEGKSDALFFDDDVPGFGLRIRAGGKKTWIVQYRVGKQQRRVTLGTTSALDPEKARKAARERLAQVTLGGDPQSDKIKARASAAITFGSLVNTYLQFKEASVRESTYAETKRYLSEHWKTLHKVAIHEIRRRDIAVRLTEISKESGPIAAARARVALSGMFTWAVREGIVDANPVIGTNKPAEPKSRDRVLTDTELAEVWAACPDNDYGRIVKLLLLTGGRREEIGGLTWQEINIGRAELNLPANRTKNARPHIIPLSPLALSIIGDAPQRDGRDHLFGEGTGAFSGWSKAKAALDRRILEARRTHQPGGELKPMPAWRLHDLRRTVATQMADLGIQPHVIEAVLNHVSGSKAGVAGVYNRSLYAAEKRAALELWAGHVQAVIEGPARK